jgi:hypothetical protein
MFLMQLSDANIVFWVQFDNKEFQQKQLFNFPTLPTVNGTTFFRVNINNSRYFQQLNIENKSRYFHFQFLWIQHYVFIVWVAV